MLAAVRRGALSVNWEISPQKLANTVWAFTTLTVHDVEFLEAVRRQTLVNTVWAIATLAVHDDELLEAVRRGTMCEIWEVRR